MPQPIHLKDHEKDARLVRRRVIVGAVAVVLLTLVLVARMYHLQVTQYEYHSTLSENNRVHVQPIPPTRGIIFDRNGVIIADNRPSFSLTITRERTEDLQKTLDTLVEILGLTEDDRAIFEKRMKQGRRPFEPVPIMFELNEEQIARIAVNQFRLPGVDVATQFVRHYPLKEHFAHSVGYVGRINEQELKNLDPINYSGTHHIGKTGIERFYESESCTARLATRKSRPTPAGGAAGAQAHRPDSRQGHRPEHRQPPAGGRRERPGRAAGRHRGDPAVHRRRAGDGQPAELRPQPVRHRHQLQGLCRAA